MFIVNSQILCVQSSIRAKENELLLLLMSVLVCCFCSLYKNANVTDLYLKEHEHLLRYYFLLTYCFY